METGLDQRALVYHSALNGDVVMSPDPIDMPLNTVARIVAGGNNLQLRLEPGDATRYDIVVCPLFQPHLQQLLVARLTPSGEMRSAATVPVPRVAGEFAFNTAADVIAINDGWERKFFRWWLTLLWRELEHVR